MRTGNGDRMRLHPHQLGEHLSARNHRNRSPPRFDDFRIVVAHRGRTHHHVRVADVRRMVAFGDFDAKFFEARRHFRFLLIGT